ncbi:hypothetical protein F5Y15DRAFT_347302 [Xylariaceae sp. FL0016]|nr:hypothetical protein F5Y15DRAFT_347302 [Xylariaceae sp. FL0016]
MKPLSMVTRKPIFNHIASLSTHRIPVSSITSRLISSYSVHKMASDTPAAAAAVTSAADVSYKPRYIDIGINLADPVFRGRYHGVQRHPDDLDAVISRGQEVGCQKLIITGSDFKSSRNAIKIAQQYPGTVYTTAGIHPCSSAIFGTKHTSDSREGHSTPCDPDPEAPTPEDHDPDPVKSRQIISDLRALIEEARSTHPTALVAFGEFGLDYDRLPLCGRKIQLHSFAAQLDLVLSLRPQLPLFLHSRAAHADFVGLLKEKCGPRLEKLEKGGVVHSFTGTADELRELMDLGLHIGANGCSFKTAENCEVVRAMRLDRLMLETDGPWCEVRPSHEGWKYLVASHKASKGESTSTPDASTTPTLTPGTATPAASTPGTSTPVSDQAGQQPRKSKKPQRKEPEVPERWRSVKKEKWAEGCMIKSRNEPCSIERVGAVVAAIKGTSIEEVCEAAWRNTQAVFELED